MDAAQDPRVTAFLDQLDAEPGPPEFLARARSAESFEEAAAAWWNHIRYYRIRGIVLCAVCGVLLVEPPPPSFLETEDGTIYRFGAPRRQQLKRRFCCPTHWRRLRPQTRAALRSVEGLLPGDLEWERVTRAYLDEVYALLRERLRQTRQ